MHRALVFGLLLLLGVAASSPSRAQGGGSAANDEYPTAARSEYVFACMTVNGGTRDALDRCSCSIDVIASILPYGDYERAETILRMRQLGGGYLAQEFRVPLANDAVRTLREAQAEAEVRCF